MKQPYNTALYMRLSRDDETYGDSVSIETQRIILQKYAEENGFTNTFEYVDDGYSGTNFERPGFKKMMDDVDAGKINCIIVKDLSRFGREHIMMGMYFEFTFPEKNIRFISVTENEDSAKGLSDFVPIKVLFCEWYAKDTSRKVKTALHAKFAAGQRIGAYAPLGYRKHPDQKNKLIVDEETSWIIEKIFDLAFHGAGAAKITKNLIEERVPTAGWLNYTRYGTFANIYADAPEEKSYAWTIAQVKCILKDETYIGNSVHGKQTNISYKNKKRVRKPEEEWFRVENTHDAIISRDVFEQVQEQIARRRRSIKDSVPQIFAGLVRCADCGWSMSFGTNKSNSKPFSYFNCTSYRQFGKTGGTCSAHYIRYDTLYDYVLARLQYWSEQAELGEEELLKRLLNSGDKAKADLMKKQTAELSKSEKRKAEVDRLFMKLYEDWSSGRITEYNFNMLSQKYQDEQTELDGRIAELKDSLSKEQQSTEDAEKWIVLIRQFACPTELTAELLNTVIEKIVVHEAVKHEDGSREQEVEIYYRFIGKIE